MYITGRYNILLQIPRILRRIYKNLFDQRDSFPFSIVRIPDKSSNVPSSIAYSAIGAESIRTAKASNNPELFSTAIKPLISCMSRQGVSIGRIVYPF